MHRDEWTHIDTHGHICSTTFTFYIFCDMHVCQRYKFYIWHATDIHMHRYTNTCTHIYRETSTYSYRHMHTDIHKHTCRHTQTHMHIFYIHKYTYIYVRSILPAHFIFSCHLPNELRSPCTYFLMSKGEKDNVNSCCIDTHLQTIFIIVLIELRKNINNKK